MDYHLKINEFEGPLDLLLFLIKEHKMDIFDISISDICSQYINYIEQMIENKLEVASEYLVMASTLIEIKSKLLIPKEEIEVDITYEEDTRETLIERLLEYQAYKKATNQLILLNESRNLYYTKEPELQKPFIKVKQFHEVYASSVYDLLDAFTKMAKRKQLETPEMTNLNDQEFSIEESIDKLRQYLINNPKTYYTFMELINKNDPTSIIATFVALLDLIKNDEIKFKQSSNFADIELRR